MMGTELEPMLCDWLLACTRRPVRERGEGRGGVVLAQSALVLRLT